MTSPVFTGKASVKRVLNSENVFEKKLYRIFKCCLRTGRLGRTQELLLDGMKISAELPDFPEEKPPVIKTAEEKKMQSV